MPAMGLLERESAMDPLEELIIGYRRDGSPIFIVRGAEPEDDDGDEIEGGEDEGDPSDDDNGDEPEDEEEDKAPPKKAPAKKAAPTKAAPSRQYETALSREREARKNAERQLRELRRKGETDADRVAREADEFAAAKYKPAAARAAARAGLAEAKIKGDVSRAVRLLDLENVDIDDDGEVVGLDEQIAALKTDYPELFEASAPRRRIPPKADGAGRRAPKTEPKTSAEKIAHAYGMA